MSGGSLNYLALKMNDELYNRACVHYSNVGNHKEARLDNPFEDSDISELVFDVACVVHALEWYKSGDICEETYREILAKFKKNYILDEPIDIRVHNIALELDIRQITESCVEMDFPFKWICASENCDRRCEVKKGRYEGKLAFNCERECWRDFFLKKAGEEVSEDD